MNTSENQNQSHAGDEDIANELAGIITSGQPERRFRIHGLSLAGFIGALRLLRQIEDALLEYGDRWENAYAWGRGMPFPDETRPTPAEVESAPFGAVVGRLGNALADVVDHPDCPDDLARWISDLDCNVANELQDLGVQLRTRFVALIAKAAEGERKEPERPALRAA